MFEQGQVQFQHNLDHRTDEVQVNMMEYQRPTMPFLLDYGFKPPLLGKDVWLTPDQASWTFHLPIIGRIRIVRDPVGSVFALFILFFWIYNVGCVYYIILLPGYYAGSISVMLPLIFGTIAALCISSFFRASTINPGALSSAETPDSDWNICIKCNMNRPPGTHHCRRCGQCVKKMDHHCPWINNCVGEENQFIFMLLLFYAYILSVFTLVLDVCSLFDIIPCLDCSELIFGIRERTLLWISFGMAIFMTCSGFSLYMVQHFSILFEIPSMEFNRMQMEFMLNRRLPAIWPKQTKSTFSVYRNTCGQGPFLCYICPCRKRKASTPYPRERLV